MSDNRENENKTRKGAHPNSLANLKRGEGHGGRKKTPQEFKDLALNYSVPALQRVIDIMMSDDSDNKDVLKAAEMVMDRGVGKAIQALDVEVNKKMVIELKGAIKDWAK